MNEINVIVPYKYLGMWIFDDPKVGLVQEPFVGGADTMIDTITNDISNAATGFLMVFPLPLSPVISIDWNGAGRKAQETSTTRQIWTSTVGCVLLC